MTDKIGLFMHEAANLSLTEKIGLVVFAVICLYCLVSAANPAFMRPGKRATPCQKWMNGIAAGVLALNELPMDRVFGGASRFSLFSIKSKFMLRRDWDVRDKAGAVELMQVLASPLGMHNADLVEMAEKCGADQLSEAEFITQFPAKGNNEFLYLKMVYRAYQRFGENAIIAWDIGRAVFLYGQFYAAGFVSREEALDASLALCQRAQKIYRSWDEFIESYLDGVLFWKNGDQGAAYRRAQLFKALKDERDSPFHLPWNQPLQRDWQA